MFTENQPITIVEKSQLVQKVADLKKDGYRLVQICCTLTESFEVTYSFDKGYSLVNLRLTVSKADAEVPSITGEYLAAFTYENELQDLFGLKVPGMQLNFNGTFYKLAIKTPFNQPKPQPAAQ